MPGIIEIRINAVTHGDPGNVWSKAEARSIFRRANGQLFQVLARIKYPFGGEEAGGEGLVVSRCAHGDGNATRQGDPVIASISQPDFKGFLNRENIICNHAPLVSGPRNANSLGSIIGLAHVHESFLSAASGQEESLG